MPPRGPKEGGIATSPLHSRGSPTPSEGEKSKLASSPLPSRGPTSGRNCYVTPAFSGIPNAKRREKIRIGCLTPAFSGAQKRVGLLRHPCILGGPQQRGDNQNWLPHPCLLGGPQVGGIATSPLHSWGSPRNGRKSEWAAPALPSRGPTSGRDCYVTLAISGVPNAKRGEKIRIGFLTPAFSGAHKWAEVLRNPCALMGPQQRGQNQKWLHWGQGQNFECAAQKNICVEKHP